MVLMDISSSDTVILSVMVYIAALFFLVSGINLIVNRNQKAISKKAIYRDPLKLTLLFGICETSVGGFVTLLHTIGLLIKSIFFVVIIIDAALLLGLVLFEIIYGKSRRIK